MAVGVGECLTSTVYGSRWRPVLVLDMALEGLLPLVLCPANGAGADVISVHVLVGLEVLPAGKALTAGFAGELGGGGGLVEGLV